jgi:hypothetical protein
MKKRRAKRKPNRMRASQNGRKSGAIRCQQGHNQLNAFQAEASGLEDLIWREQRVRCSVKVDPDMVKIRAASFGDYVLAKLAIKGRVSSEIVQG